MPSDRSLSLSFFLSLSLSPTCLVLVCVSASLSVSPFVCAPVCACMHPSVCLPVCLRWRMKPHAPHARPFTLISLETIQTEVLGYGQRKQAVLSFVPVKEHRNVAPSALAFLISREPSVAFVVGLVL